MASSINWSKQTVWGDLRVLIGTMTATDGTDAVATGLQTVTMAMVCGQTATNDTGVVWNTAASGLGDVALVTGTSAGTYNLIVMGN